MGYAMGHQTKISIDGVAMCAVSETLALKENHIEPKGMVGSRGKRSEDVRTGTRTVSGQIVIEPSPLWLGTLLKLAMGAFSAPTATLEEAVPSFTVIADRVTKVLTYANCKCNQLELKASKGQFVQATLDVIGIDESVDAAASFGAYSPSTQAPLALHDLAATIIGVGSRVVDDVTITIKNNLLADRFFNSQVVTDIPEGMREIILGMMTPYDSTHYDLYRPTAAGVAASLAFTNGAISATLAFAKWQIPSESPTVPGRDGEIFLKLSGPVRKDGATKELIVTIDSTA
jgi:hypothetical protein